MRWKKAEYSGWGRVLKATGSRARPEKVSALRDLIKAGAAPALGNLRSYGDACLNTDGKAIDMTRLDRFIEFDENTGILHAEAGVTIGTIARLFAPRGWFPTVMPGTGFATLGGCIANDVHGKNHHMHGSFGQHVRSISLLGANGRLRRVTPQDTPDLFAATLGGIGQTGIIVSAGIQLARCPSEVMEVRERRSETLEEFMAMLESSTATYNVGWIDATAEGAELGRGILEEAEIKIQADPLPVAKARSISRDAPRFMLNPAVVRLFNRYYLRRVPPQGRTLDRSIADFFFPLDRISGWNRLYGKPGFHQFQCVVPDANAAIHLRKMLQAIGRSKLASPLAVLKRLGDGRAGLMSFPMRGYTLAVDFPNRAKAAALVQELEDIACDAGGRVYLAKDALSRAGRIARMYPELPEFTKIIKTTDPKGVFATDMVRRLQLRGKP